MEIVTLLFQQNIIMMLYLLIGYVLYKRRLITKQGSGELGRLLLYVVMPVAILKSYIREFEQELLVSLMISFCAALASLILSMAVSRLVFHKKSAVREFGTAFSNAGFIGIPLVQMVIGSDAVFYIASFVALLNILQWTYGVFLMTKDKETVRLKKIVTNPIVLSFAAGLLLFLLPVRLPDMAMTVITTIAGMNGPLAMIVLGVYLAQIPIHTLFTDRDAYLCAAVRLLLVPALTILLLFFIPAEYRSVRMAMLIVASAPVGSNVAIFAQAYGKEYTDAVKDICLSTVLSILTMPFMIGIANLVW